MQKIILLLITLFTPLYLIGQDGFTIDPYEGQIFDYPEEDVDAGYGEHIYENEELGKIIWETINIPARKTTKKFKNIEYTTLFGMVIHSKIHVTESGCFEITISSDDGSKVWINEELLIDNGGIHRMLEKKESIYLGKGSHSIKIWYFQAYHTHYGLIFNVDRVGKDCPERETSTLTLSNKILFDTDEFTIKKEAFSELDSICTLIKSSNIKSIKVIGHTDQNGAAQYNLLLSQKRADSILKYLKVKLKMASLIFEAVGMGETQPLVDENGKSEIHKNRRVEIVFDAIEKE